MITKEKIIADLNKVFNLWEDTLSGMTEDQILTPRLSGGRSIKDIIAHLWAWQQVTFARMEAARENQLPKMPGWLEGSDPESEEETDTFNDRIYMDNRNLTWTILHNLWRKQYLKLLKTIESFSEDDLQDSGKYPWLKGSSLMDVLFGTFDHHDEHIPDLMGK